MAIHPAFFAKPSMKCTVIEKINHLDAMVLNIETILGSTTVYVF
jgi:hypothetical protein